MAAPDILAKLERVPAATARAVDECLSDEDVLEFANGTLNSSRQTAAHFHLDQCELCQRLLSEAAHALGTAATAPLPDELGELDETELSWHTTFQPGTLVGQRYLIRHFIARGGMGEVYEAFDRDLQERVALKTVTSTAGDNAHAARRLKAEVQLARRVSHPNVCRIYDFGTHVMPNTGAPIYFLTMEFVDGVTLGERVRRVGALPAEEARELGRQLLRGLSAAHQAGVLHRDFKSDNVMLRADAGSQPSPLILDFGLARAAEADSGSASSRNSNLLGTFGYIAPEQIQGDPHSTASDVYAFGVAWFEMLTGVLPFESTSSPAAAALARLERPAPAPSSKNPLVPSDLDAVVLGCLQRSPKDRFQTAGEALAALEALEAGARSAFHKRRIAPLIVAAALGGVAAYAAAVPSAAKADRSVWRAAVSAVNSSEHAGSSAPADTAANERTPVARASEPPADPAAVHASEPKAGARTSKPKAVVHASEPKVAARARPLEKSPDKGPGPKPNPAPAPASSAQSRDAPLVGAAEPAPAGGWEPFPVGPPSPTVSAVDGSVSALPARTQ